MNPFVAAANLLISPITALLTKRQERKAASESAKHKLTQAKADGVQEVTLNEQEIEVVRTNALGNSWKDEYITLSVVMFLNLIVAGSIAAAFGYDGLLTGMTGAVLVLTSMHVDMGELIRIVILAGVGVSVWRRM